MYLTGRRNNSSDASIRSFTAYSNIGTPELFINGKSYGKMAEGNNRVHFVSKEIVLGKGQNKIKIRVDYDNTQYQDDYELNINTHENE